MKRTIGKAIIASLLITVTRSSADIGWYGDSPGHITLEGEENPSIALISEVVLLELKGSDPTMGYVNVKGCFDFYNEGPAARVMMAYPLSEDEFFGESSDTFIRDLMEDRGVSKAKPVSYRVFNRKALGTADFRSGFDAQIRDYRDIEVTVDGGQTEVEFVFRDALESNSFKTSRYVRWPVDFAAGQTKRVEIAFKNPYERKGGYGASQFHYNFEYPLYTGRTWAGPIGEGTITVVYEEDTISGPIFFQSPGCPAAHVESENGETEITWSWHDFEPPENARIKTVKGSPYHWPGSSVAQAIDLEVQGEPAITLTEDIALKVEPAEDAADVEGVREFPLRTPFGVQSSRGEWWHVKLNDGTEGWLRWREVNPDTGEERLNAAFAYYLTE
jgi:hypothetical protein